MPWRPQPGLQVDSAKCLDRIPPAALRAKTPAAPASRWQRKAWLPAGVLEDGHVAPTAAGTPPGGTISPLLALRALHGLDEASPRGHPQARVSADADDGVGRPADRRVLAQRQPLLRLWLAELGLPLPETQRHIGPTLAGEDPGVALLGFPIRPYRVGKPPSGQRPGGQRLGANTLS